MSEIRPTGNVPEAPASSLRPNFGTDSAPSQAVKGMPFNYGESLLPHVVTFQGIVSSVSRVYRYYDEAMKASLENARFMRNDLMIMEPVEQRRRACALLNWHLETDDPDNPAEKTLCEDLTKIIKTIPNFLKFRENLLDAVWFGKNANQWNYRWKKVRGVSPVTGLGMSQVIDNWKPVHGDKIVFRYDDGTREYDPNQIGIRVGAGYTAGDKGIQGRLNASGRRKVEPTDYGLAYFLEPWERQLLAIHKHMIEDGEYEDPQAAGKIHGLGIRSRIYWSWYMKQELHAWLLEYIERCAAGIEIWYYPFGNPEGEAKARKAAEERIGNGRNVILMPRPVGEDAQAFGVEIIQPNMAGADTVERILTEYFGDQIMRYVLGQTMTNKAQSAGLGSDLPQIQLGSYLQIIKYDAINLGETLTTDVVEPLKARNYPHLQDIPVRFVIDTESEDMQQKLEAWKAAYDCGLKTKAADWYRIIGAAKPEEDDEIIENPVNKQQDRLYQQYLEHKQQAAMMGMTPEGTPQPGEPQSSGPAQVQGGLGEEPNPEADSPPAELEVPGGPAGGPERFSMNAGQNPRPDDYRFDADKYQQDGDKIDPAAVEHGAKHEAQEHGFGMEQARKVAMDHLRENPHYYQIVEKALAESSDTKAEMEPERYLMPDGSRMADDGIHQGQTDANWTIPAARRQYSASAGGPAGQDAKDGGNGCACPAGHRTEETPERFAKRKPAAGQRGMFREEDHPRDDGGLFAEKGGGGGGGGKPNEKPVETPEKVEPLAGQQSLLGEAPVPAKPTTTATMADVPKPTPKQRQEAMFHGLNDLPGQQDLFNSDKGAVAAEQEPPAKEKESTKEALSPEVRQLVEERNRILSEAFNVANGTGYDDFMLRTERADYERRLATIDSDLRHRGYDRRRLVSLDRYLEGRFMQRDLRRVAEQKRGTEVAYARSADPGYMHQQFMARYYKASDNDTAERFWAGEDGEITVIQENKPIRYSRKRGNMSVVALC